MHPSSIDYCIIDCAITTKNRIGNQLTKVKTTLNACYHSENIDDIIVLSLSIQQGTESQQSCCSDPADHCDLKVLFIQHFLN